MPRGWIANRRGAAEKLAVGAPASFDGNYTDDLATWLMPDAQNPEWDPENPELMEMLLEWTAQGHLRWVLFLW